VKDPYIIDRGDWLTGSSQKVHSLVDKVYQRKDLAMAWEQVRTNRGSLEAELEFVAEHDALDVTEYREELAQVIGNQDIQAIAHDRIIEKLDESAKLFRVLILNSTLTIPYRSIELDCGYWTSAAEQRLRFSIAGQRSPGTATKQTENNKSWKR
jgi:hypothetical protein